MLCAYLTFLVTRDPVPSLGITEPGAVQQVLGNAESVQARAALKAGNGRAGVFMYIPHVRRHCPLFISKQVCDELGAVKSSA